MRWLLTGYVILAISTLCACTHSVNHKPISHSLPTAQNDQSVLLVIPPESRAFTETHSNLSGNKWFFHVGSALADIAPKSFAINMASYRAVQHRDYLRVQNFGHDDTLLARNQP
jgi:hypothetical protein